MAKGRRLASPAKGTRPTSDRAREGMFNSLASLLDLEGAAVLDLFAGTGAIGLEALSRGARTAVFVESAPAAATVLRANADSVGLAGAVIHRRLVSAFLDERPDHPFDLVFADPPYAFDDDALTALLARLAAPEWLGRDAVVVIERSARATPPIWPDAVYSLQHKRYGEGVLWYGRGQ